MGFWNKMFPYSNVHELNLDWLISKMKELEEALKTAVGKITGSVRYDEYQGLSDPEAQQARTNIKAAGADDVRLQIENTAVMYSETQTLQEDYKARARKNIGAIEQNDAVSPNIVQGLTEGQKALARSNIQAQSPQEALNQGKLNFVQFSAAQALTETQKKQARDNIGAGTGGGGDPEGAVLYSKAQSLEDQQKYQARQNIDAISTSYVNDNFVAAYQRQTLTPTFKANARGNIAAVSYEAQTLTTEQQAQARANIGVNGGGSLDGAVRYNAAQDLTEDQKAQARNNIGAGTGSGSGGNQVYVGDDEPRDANVLEWIDTSEDVSGYNLQELLLLAHPVGSIYQSTQSTSPATLFGGTWEALEDVFLLAAGSGHAAGSTGGEESHVLTVAELAAHNHNIARSGSVTEAEVSLGSPGQYSSNNFASLGINGIDALATTTFSISSTGGGQAHNNMPPYQAVYTWKRTA